MSGPDSGEPISPPPPKRFENARRGAGKVAGRIGEAARGGLNKARDRLADRGGETPDDIRGRATPLPTTLRPSLGPPRPPEPPPSSPEAPVSPAVMRAVTDDSLLSVLGVDSWTDLSAIRKGDVGVDVIDTRAAARIAAAAGDPALATRLQQGLDEWHRRLAERQVAGATTGEELLPYGSESDRFGPFNALTLRETMQEAGIDPARISTIVGLAGEEATNNLNSKQHYEIVRNLRSAQADGNWEEIARLSRQLDANSAWYYKTPRHLPVDEALLDRLPPERRTLRQLLIDAGVQDPDSTIGEIGRTRIDEISTQLREAREAARASDNHAEVERLSGQMEVIYELYERLRSAGRPFTTADLDTLPPGVRPPGPDRTIPSADTISASSPAELKSEYVDQLCTVLGVKRADLVGKNPDEVRRIIGVQTGDAVADGWITPDALNAALATLSSSIMSGALQWEDLTAAPASQDPARAATAVARTDAPMRSGSLRREGQHADVRPGWRRRATGYIKEKTPQLVAETLNVRTWPQEEVVYAEPRGGEAHPDRPGPTLRFEDLPLPEPGALLDKYSVSQLLDIMGVNSRLLVGTEGDARIAAIRSQFDSAYQRVEAACFGDKHHDGDPRFAEVLATMDNAAAALGKLSPKELENYFIRLSGGTPLPEEPAPRATTAPREPEKGARTAVAEEENPFAGYSLDQLLEEIQTGYGEAVNRADLGDNPEIILQNLASAERDAVAEAGTGEDPAENIAEQRQFFAALRERLMEEGLLPRRREETAPAAATTEPDVDVRPFSEEYIGELFGVIDLDRRSVVDQDYKEIERIIGEAISHAEETGVDHDRLTHAAQELMRLRDADPVAYFAGLATAPPTETTPEKAPDTRVTAEDDSGGEDTNTAELMDSLGLDLGEFRANDPEANEKALDRALAEIREGFADSPGIREYYDRTEAELRQQLEEQELLPDPIRKAPISQLVADIGGLESESIGDISKLSDQAISELLTRRHTEIRSEAEELKEDPANEGITADLDQILGEIERTHRELRRRETDDPRAFYDSIRGLQ